MPMYMTGHAYYCTTQTNCLTSWGVALDNYCPLLFGAKLKTDSAKASHFPLQL